MEELTKKEEEVMRILWRIKKGFVKDVIAEMEGPEPPYTTISSIIRILVKKGYVKNRQYGTIHEYYPALSKMDYQKFLLKNLVSKYFDNSFENVVSFMVKENDLSKDEVNEILKTIDKTKSK